MEMLRHHSHGFNLESVDKNGVPEALMAPKATPSLRELLTDKEKLIADYDKQIKDKEEKRKPAEMEPHFLESFPNGPPLQNSPDDNKGKKSPR